MPFAFTCSIFMWLLCFVCVLEVLCLRVCLLRVVCLLVQGWICGDAVSVEEGGETARGI